MAKLYRTETTLQDILNMKVGDELKLSGGDLPDYTERDAGKSLVVNQNGTGLEWGPGLPSYTSSDVGKVLTVGEGELVQTVIVPEQTVTITAETPFSVLTGTVDSALQNIREGSIATAVINGTTYRAVGIVQPGGGSAYSVDELHALFVYTPRLGGALFGINDPETEAGTYTVSLTGVAPSVAPAWGYCCYKVNLSDTYSNNIFSMLQNALNDALTHSKSYSVKVSNVALSQSDIKSIMAGVSVMEDGGYAVGKLTIGTQTAFLPFALRFTYDNGFSVQSVVPYYTMTENNTNYYLRITIVNTVTVESEAVTTTTVMVEIIGYDAK